MSELERSIGMLPRAVYTPGLSCPAVINGRESPHSSSSSEKEAAAAAAPREGGRGEVG